MKRFNKIPIGQKHKGLLLLFLTILCLFFIVLTVSTIVGISNKIKESRNRITVTDTGEIYAKPDLALMDFSVVTEEKTVSEAMSKNVEKMNKIIAVLKEQGIEEKDLKTVSFNIYPRYEYWQEEKCLVPPCPSGKRVLVGYEVRQTLEVKIRSLDKIGLVIEKATALGANQVGDLQMTIDNQDELKKQARAEAIEEAKAKAENLASQLEVKLTRIVNFAETSYVPLYGLEKGVAVEGGIGGAGTPTIETGENKITVTVTITYEIR